MKDFVLIFTFLAISGFLFLMTTRVDETMNRYKKKQKKLYRENKDRIMNVARVEKPEELENIENLEVPLTDPAYMVLPEDYNEKEILGAIADYKAHYHGCRVILCSAGYSGQRKRIVI